MLKRGHIFIIFILDMNFCWIEQFWQFITKLNDSYISKSYHPFYKRDTELASLLNPLWFCIIILLFTNTSWIEINFKYVTFHF